MNDLSGHPLLKPGFLTHLRDLLATLLRQLYARVGDDALRGDLGGLLVLGAGRLHRTITIDLEAVALPDAEALGRVCAGCLKRTADGTRLCWLPDAFAQSIPLPIGRIPESLAASNSALSDG